MGIRNGSSWILPLCLFVSFSLAAQPLSERLKDLVARDPLSQRAFVGFAVMDPETGETLSIHNGNVPFTPASNTKLFSTALALMRLGPEHRLHTEVYSDGLLDADSGVLRGNLVIKGYGDPSLGSRTFPYSRETEDLRDYSLPALEDLAREVTERGIRRITGDVIGDDTSYIWEPFREGWAQDDALYEYGAPVSALTVNDNTVSVTISPGAKIGEPASVSISPVLPYYDVLNAVKTTASGLRQIRWERVNGKQLILIDGAIPIKGRSWSATIAIDDPALYAARFLRDSLERHGVEVEGLARARHRYSAEVGDADILVQETSVLSLALHESPPMREIIQMVNKESMNLYAEILLCEVSRAKNGFGSREAGLEELAKFLKEARVSSDGVAVKDASGLARLNLLSPVAVAELLVAMWRSEHRADWVDSLPIGGTDGTLDRRFGGNPAGSKIRAKTGTLRGVSALSGYATTGSGKVIAFSAMVNNYTGSSRAARELLDRIALEVVATP